MFDRIAGFYDLMNSVMTAGLHHRWRERAADLAGLRPGDRALDVATGTGDLAVELARRVAPGGEVIGSDFSRGDARARPHEGAGADAGSGATRSSCPIPTTASTPPRSASARATSPTSSAGWPRWRGSCARRPRGRAGDHDADQAAACRRSSRSGSIASCRCSARFDEAYTYLPNSVKRFPGPEALGGVLAARGADRRALDPHRRRDHRPALRDGGRDGVRRGRRRGHRGRRRARAGAARPARGAARRARRLARRGARRARRRDDRGRRQAAAAAARVRGGRGRAAGAGVLRAAVAVELIHSATLVHDDVLDGAALRRGRPTVVAAAGRASSRPPPATCCSRARSPSWPPTGAPTRSACSPRPPRRWPRASCCSARTPGTPGRTRERYLAPLRAQDRAAVRGGVRARRARGRRPARAARGASGAASGWRSSCSTTCSTSPGRPSGPASTAAPTCSTARSRCR